MSRGLILGIETSCDETAAAIVERGARTLSSVVASQIATHARYGGVVPELASREHLRAIVPVVRAALAEANVTLADLDAIAVTSGPGLAGALLVGITYAKALAFANDLPLIAVNHLEGHIHAVLLNERESAAPRDAGPSTRPLCGLAQDDSHLGGWIQDAEPSLALVVSGGHTHLYLARPAHGTWSYTLIGRTVDDAAGEAFDKVAKLLALGYPGGPVIDALARHGDPTAVNFPAAQLKHRDRKDRGPAPARPHFDFSFSGIKTAVLRYVETEDMSASIAARRSVLAQLAKPGVEDALKHCDRRTLDLVASFQRGVVHDLAGKTLAAAREYQAATLLVSGGVAANSELRQVFERKAAQEGLRVLFPSRPLSTDNAAMIAAAAYPKWLARDFASIDVTAEASLPLR